VAGSLVPALTFPSYGLAGTLRRELSAASSSAAGLLDRCSQQFGASVALLESLTTSSLGLRWSMQSYQDYASVYLNSFALLVARRFAGVLKTTRPSVPSALQVLCVSLVCLRPVLPWVVTRRLCCRWFADRTAGCVGERDAHGAAARAVDVAVRRLVRACSLPCCAVLCCAVLCCAVLCCAVLCCAVLCCAVLCCAALRCAALC
jgi:hypothetical protein